MRITGRNAVASVAALGAAVAFGYAGGEVAAHFEGAPVAEAEENLKEAKIVYEAARKLAPAEPGNPLVGKERVEATLIVMEKFGEPIADANFVYNKTETEEAWILAQQILPKGDVPEGMTIPTAVVAEAEETRDNAQENLDGQESDVEQTRTLGRIGVGLATGAGGFYFGGAAVDRLAGNRRRKDGKRDAIDVNEAPKTALPARRGTLTGHGPLKEESNYDAGVSFGSEYPDDDLDFEADYGRGPSRKDDYDERRANRTGSTPAFERVDDVRGGRGYERPSGRQRPEEQPPVRERRSVGQQPQDSAVTRRKRPNDDERLRSILDKDL